MADSARLGLDAVEASLADLAQPFGAIFDQAGLGLIVSRIEDGTIVLTNPAYEELLGYTAAELRGTRFLDHTHPDDRRRNLTQWQSSLKGGQPYRIEKRYLCKDGTPVWVEVSSTFVADDAGLPRFAFSVVQDIGARKEAEAALLATQEELRNTNDLLQSLVSAAPVAIVGTDLDGHVTMWNRAAERLLGWSAEEAVGQALPSVSPADLAEATALRERVLAGEVLLDVEISRVRKDGMRIDLSTSLAPRRDRSGHVVGIVRFMVDIGERVRAKSQLEQSLAVLRKTDQPRRDLLAKLVRTQDEERHRIAEDIHDDAVQGMVAVGLRLSLLRRSLTGADAALVDELEENVSGAIGRLRQLLFDLRPSELDRGGLASALRMSLQQARESLGLEWHLDNRLASEPPLEVRTTAYRIARDAITNARRHAGAHAVEVVLETMGDGVSVSITDDGKGGAQEDESVPGSDHHVSLVEMRERAELAGGWFRIESAPGGGTTIRFWVPASGAGVGSELVGPEFD